MRDTVTIPDRWIRSSTWEAGGGGAGGFPYVYVVAPPFL